MSKVYNFYNLEALFRTFLTAGNKVPQPVTIKNYLSDLRHFLGWFVVRLKNKNIELDTIDSDNLSDHLTSNEIAQYRAYLKENGIPVKTINRRLSTLRKFCSFCISQRWMDENPAKHIKNITHASSELNTQVNNDLVLENFKKSLIEEGLAQQEAQKLITEVRDLLSL